MWLNTRLATEYTEYFEGTEGLNYSEKPKSLTRALGVVANIGFSTTVQNGDAELKMQENKNRKQELESAIKEYLSRAEIYPMSDSWELAQTGDYVMVFGMTPFHKQDDPESYCFLAPEEAERKLIYQIDRLFESQIRAATVRKSLQRAITLTDQDTEFIFSFETDEQEQQYHDKIYEYLYPYLESRCDALVPMYQLECAYGVEFPLANAVLYAGDSNSQLATIANDDDYHFTDTDSQQIENRSFLKFPVQGDPASRLEQVEFEAERALQVLRFIYPWFEKDGKSYNPAHGVSTWKHSWRVIVFDRTPETRVWSPWNSAKPNGIHGTQRIGAELLNDAKKYYYLDSINYHFQNHDLNLVSRRFCRAFKFYDIASQTSDADVALANFTISVDILLPSGKGWELTSYLISLIEKGGLYEGKMTLNKQLSDPNKTGWPERVKLTVSDYKAFYLIRNKVVHGNTMSGFVSDMQVKKSRQIAKNAIRAYAKLSRAFPWENDKEAKNWFKEPCKPPEMNNS